MMIGTIVSHYRILEHLGAGGMGEVYRAHDERLDRDVAIKVLPEEVAQVPQRLARFEREAKLLAQLNHPNIATLYGLEEHNGQGFLVMELVEGEDLDRRIRRGQIPVDEALPIARQIAEGLEAAHEQGIIHRDLKPANVMLSPEGKVKILDFGLAKAWHPEDSDVDPHSPTVTGDMTREGVLIGTASYMSPEQARGKPVDKRTDIWAFGCLLWEVLAGKRLFNGESQSDVIAAVLGEEPDLTALPSDLPPNLRRLIGRCLEKEPRQRLRDIGEARIEIGEGIIGRKGDGRSSQSGDDQERQLGWSWALIAGAAGIAIGAAITGYFLGRDHPSGPQVVQLPLPAPAGTTYHLESSNPGPVAVSPDGRMLVFSARDRSRVFSAGNEFKQVVLYLRRLDAADAQPMQGTEGATYPFWSPDSRWIGFFADGKLKKIKAGGGPPTVLCEASDGKGGSWGPSGDIIFAPGPGDPIHRVSDAGGAPSPITSFDLDRGDFSHRHPRHLPGGRDFLYLALTDDGYRQSRHSVVVASVVEDRESVLLRSPAAAEYASGRLFYVNESTLMAREFDPDRLEFRGDAAPVCTDVLVIGGAGVAVFSASSSGVIACQPGGGGGKSRLTWFDRNGRQIGTLGEPADFIEVHLSPDGTKAAVGVAAPPIGAEDKFARTVFDRGPMQSDIWVYSVDREVASRLTSDPHREDQIHWSPDSTSIAFGRRKPESPDIYRISLGGSSTAEPLLESELYALPTDWSPDGQLLAFDSFTSDTGWDQWVLPLGGGEPYPFLRTPFNEADGVFSPDGRWMAYESDESGRWEIYITPFPGPGRRWRVSKRGGITPRWNSSGCELFFVSELGDVMGVAIGLDNDPVEIGTPGLLIEGRLTNFSDLDGEYSPAPGGGRFLLITRESRNQPLNVILNWDGALPQ